MSSRKRGYCFTLNNYTEVEYEHVCALSCSYLVCGRERGESGTPHLQGYVYFKDACSFRSVGSRIPRAHVEVAKGSGQQNFDYCSKGGDFVEFGVRPVDAKSKGEAESVRWDASLASAKKGKFEDIPADIYIRYVRSLEYIASKSAVEPVANSFDSKNLWYYGGPGTGKSRAARALGEMRQVVSNGDAGNGLSDGGGGHCGGTRGVGVAAEGIVGGDNGLVSSSGGSRESALVDGGILGVGELHGPEVAELVYKGLYIKEPNDKWWDGYIGQELVIIDDFDKYNLKQSGDMKRWLDIYPFQAQMKGSMMMIRPKRIVVTSNYHPDEIWDDELTRGAIVRRCELKLFD